MTTVDIMLGVIVGLGATNIACLLWALKEFTEKSRVKRVSSFHYRNHQESIIIIHGLEKRAKSAEAKLGRILTPLYVANAHRRLKSQLTKSLQQETTRRLKEGV